MNKKVFFLLLLLITVVFFISAEDQDVLGLSFDINNHVTDTVVYYNELDFSFWFSMPFLNIVADLSFINDDKYQADISNLPDGTLLGYYSVMNSGYIDFEYDSFRVTVGQKEHADFIDSDYSLFISGNKNPAFIADFCLRRRFYLL